jgi:cytosine deaminase
MDRYELIVRGATCVLPDGKMAERSLAIEGGFIRKVVSGAALELEAEEVLDARGKTLLPGFIDIHTHPDKTMTRGLFENKSGTLSEAIGHFAEFFPTVQVDDFYRRAKEMFELQRSRGVTAVRAHVTVNELVELRAFEALRKLKKELEGTLDLQLVAFPGSPVRIEKGDSRYRLLERAIEGGADALGGCPNLADDHRSLTDTLLELAASSGVPVDFHVDESDEPDVRALEYLADTILEGGFDLPVTAGHCTALAAVDDETAARVIGKMAQAGLRVVTLPSCNLYLMGRGDAEPKRRGITRVHELMEAGVDVAYASDNIRDPFRPFGNGDMLEEGLLTAQLIQYGSDEELAKVLTMATYAAARIFGYEKYGIEEGAIADLLLIDAESPVEALLSQTRHHTRFKSGRM